MDNKDINSAITCEEYISKILKTYKLISVLAERNGCKVLRLRHKKLSKDLVLHRLEKTCEAYNLLRGIRHENLPEIYDTITLSDGQIILEEFIGGLTVAQVMESGKYHKKGAKRIIAGVCDALSFLHSKGIVHRDIKPENIMVSDTGKIVLIDFNASRKQTPRKKDTEIMGTAGYASPEQIGIAKSDNRTDIYATGVLLNVLLTGVHPSEKIPPGKMGKVIKKCTSINPDNRYQSIQALKNAL